jgi:uncharacterized protein DUF3106
MFAANRTSLRVKQIIGVAVLALVFLFPAWSWALDGGDNWGNLSPKDRENVLRNYQRWQSLPPKDKEYLREEWNHWRSLPPDQREKLRKRYDQLSPNEQRQMREQFNGKRSRGDRRDE